MMIIKMFKVILEKINLKMTSQIWKKIYMKNYILI